MYYINYGLAPNFKEELVKAVKTSPYFSLSFDETLNGEIQEEQLDCHVTYGDGNRKEVCWRYLDSHFLRRPNAQNILNLLQHSLNELLPQRMVQLSVDGPSTNWKVSKLLEENRNDKEYAPLMNIGSCGLHTVHGAFQMARKPLPGIWKNYGSNVANLWWLSYKKRCVYQNMWKRRVSFKVIFCYWVFNIFLHMNFCCFKIQYIKSFSCFLCKSTNWFCCLKILACVHILLLHCFTIVGKMSGPYGLL